MASHIHTSDHLALRAHSQGDQAFAVAIPLGQCRFVFAPYNTFVRTESSRGTCSTSPVIHVLALAAEFRTRDT